MGRLSSSPLAGMFQFDRQSEIPLYEQVCRQLREAILARRLKPGDRLPASRPLSEEAHISRTTIVSAYEQLAAEGYLKARVGAGTFVAPTLPEEFLYVGENAQPSSARAPGAEPQWAGRIDRSPLLTLHEPPRPFQPGTPALDEFPFEIWGSLVRRFWSQAGPNDLAYGPSAGYAPLREAIAAHLTVARGVQCGSENVLVMAGGQQGLFLAAQVLLEPGERVCMEDPGYIGARDAFRLADANVVPVPVDEEGLDVRAARARAERARLIYVTPSHQYPLGATMCLPRRLALLNWAEADRCWILEDDYDSEFCSSSRPIPALQGLRHSQRVICLGTFSRSLFPELRLGYLVVPEALVDRFVAHRSITDRTLSTLSQAVLAEFIAQGHFARHIRRMRILYRRRQDALLRALRRKLSDFVEVEASDAGLHLVAWLCPGIDAEAASAALAREGIFANPLSAYEIERSRPEGLVMGYGCVPEEQAAPTVRRCRSVLERLAAQPADPPLAARRG